MPYQSSLTDRSCCFVGLNWRQARHDSLQPLRMVPFARQGSGSPHSPFISREGVLPDSRYCRPSRHGALRLPEGGAKPCLGDRALI
ncbi:MULTISPECIES: hypothetical protein [Aeromonas]|uniref:hypothetical protein n=1 Tax=Aeromonas TaxID=642 RepID=UPI0022DF7BFA|nr:MULTISPECIES: hypothetical protein [Aeromonas]